MIELTFLWTISLKKLCLASLRSLCLTYFTPAGCCRRMPVASRWSMESRSQMGCVCISLSNTLTLTLVPSPSAAGYCRHTGLISPSILQRTKPGMGGEGCLVWTEMSFMSFKGRRKTLAPSTGLRSKTYRGFCNCKDILQYINLTDVNAMHLLQVQKTFALFNLNSLLFSLLYNDGLNVFSTCVLTLWA